MKGITQEFNEASPFSNSSKELHEKNVVRPTQKVSFKTVLRIF